jgi:phosphoenolpyruvate carboxykinase (GTP)
MANMDFVSYPLGTYTMNNIAFGESVQDCPKIFSNNYFMRDENGDFVTSKLAKKVWLHWAEGRIHGEYDAYDTPTGKIPRFEDLKVLFKKHLDEDFPKEKYDLLFTFRCTKWIDKLERTKAYYKKMDPNTPQEIFSYWDETIARIAKAKEQYGDLILPGTYNG